MSIIQQASGRGAITLPSPVTAGNTLVVAGNARSGLGSQWPGPATGYTIAVLATFPGGGHQSFVLYRIADGFEGDTLNMVGGNISGTWYELSAGSTLGDIASANGGTGGTASAGAPAEAGPITVAAGAFVVTASAYGQGGALDSYGGDMSTTPGAGWTEDYDARMLTGMPVSWVAHQIASGGSVTGSSSNAVSAPDAAGAGTTDWAAVIAEFAGPVPPPTPGFTFTIGETDITDAFEKTIRVEWKGPGQGSFKINRHSPLATATNLAQGNIVKVTYTAISPDPIFAFFLETGDFDLVSTDEEGGENLTFGGRGVRSILGRAVMWSQSYLSTTKAILGPVRKWIWTKSGASLVSRESVVFASENLYDIDSIEALDYTPVPDYPTRIYGRLSSGPYSGKYVNQAWFATPYAGVGAWKLWAFGRKPGNILYQIIAEAQAAGRPQHPLAAMTIDFTSTTDSDGNAWNSADETFGFTVQIGENLEDIVQRLVDTGTIDVVMDPDLVLHAYNAYGRDLHSTTFATDKVRFAKGYGIADILTRSRKPELPATHVLVDGDDDIVSTAVLADAGDRPTVEIYASIEGSDTDALSDAGLGILEDGVTRLESAIFKTAVADDPTNGLYLPGPEGTNGHFWVGDLVTLWTGATTLDYINASVNVAAITLSEMDAGNLDVTPELVGTFHDYRRDREERYGRFEGVGSSSQGRGVLPGRVLPRSSATEVILQDGTLIPGSDLAVTAADVSYDNGTSGLTGTDVQAVIDELAAGGGGTLLDILGWYDAIVDGGLAGDGTTDDTSALTNLIDTATASGTRSCTIYFPAAVYLLSGNVTFPLVSLSNPQITINFVGASRPPFQPNGSIPNPNGYSVLRGTATTGTATINGSTAPTNNNIVINIKNLLCIGNDNPTITFWNLEMTYSGIIEGLMISVSPWTTAPTFPTHSSVYGVTLPQNLHSNGQQLDGVQIGGYYTCIKGGELERGRNIILGNCVIGIESNSASHSGFIESLQITSYKYGLYSTGTRYLDILNFDTERTAGTFATTADVYDPGDDLYGYIRWFEITAGVGAQHLFTVTGGANLLTEEIGPSWGGGGSPTGSAGGDLSGTYPNPTVVDDSHNHTASTIDLTGEAAGGDLSGTYPNPSVVDDSHNHTAATAPGSGTDSAWVVDPGTPSYSGTGPVTVALTSVFGIDGSGNPYYNAANVTDGEEAALVWDSVTGTYLLRPYYP